MTWLVLAALAGLAYLPLAPAPPSALRSLVKTLPLTLLALAAALYGAPLLALAFALSAVGDLALSRPGEGAFTAGLAAFALAHLAFLAVFLAAPGATPPLLPAAGVLVLALSTEAWLAPHTGPLRWPVRLYVVLIAAMTLAALRLNPLIAGGALLFLASDFLLAIQTFRLGGKGPRTLAWAVWTLYLAAQLAIAAGALSIPGGSD